jgi:N-acetylglucosaminyldiphosphoundecaprenol N-acetyl-beta-D-mannosaminyltransferase
MRTVDIMSYRVSAESVDLTAARGMRWIQQRDRPRYLACANPHSLVVASRDELFRKALQGADLLVPDGMGVVLASRLLGVPVAERVAGYEFFMALSQLAEVWGNVRYFFLGSTGEVLSRIAARLDREFPGIELCGAFSPPYRSAFGPEDNERMIAAVNEARPDVLWVGMTAPKQEKWIFENRQRLRVPLIAAIGAVFDFYAGTKPRASLMLRKLGFEWFPRFCREPVRLWERNMKSGPIFVGWVIGEALRRLVGAGEGDARTFRHRPRLPTRPAAVVSGAVWATDLDISVSSDHPCAVASGVRADGDQHQGSRSLGSASL